MPAALQAAGVSPGVTVAALAFNSVDMLTLMFGCLRAGAVWAPLNVALGAEDLDYSVGATQARVLVVSREMADRNAARLAQIARSVAVFQLEREEAPAHRWLQPLPWSASAAVQPEHEWEPDALCWIIFSGATTGRPKALALPHSYGVASALRTIETLEITSTDAFYSVLQMCHGWLLHHVIVPSLLAGIPCATTRWFSASAWLDDVRQHRATIVDPFLPMISALMAQPARVDDADNPARVCFGALGSAAENVVPRLEAFERRFGLKTINAYGLTELGGLIARETLGMRRMGTSGQPHPDYEYRIADERGQPVPAGAVGEILVRPRRPGTIAHGYLGNAEGTLKSWRDLWVHTSDLGWFDSDGFLHFAGRHAHWIRRKAENVSVKEVEEALLAVPGVAEAAVVGVSSELGDQEILAFVVTRGDGLRCEDIHRDLASRLAFFKVPRYIEAVSQLPKTVKGEVSRRELNERGIGPATWDARAGSPGSPRKPGASTHAS